MADKTVQQIQKGQIPPLKHVQTTDKSVPMIPENLHVKKFDREPFLKEVQHGTPLSHVRTMDKSDPMIEPDTVVKKVDRQYLEEIERGHYSLKKVSETQ